MLGVAVVKKLNAKQKLFVAHYAKTLNYVEAYVAAGYSAQTAYSAGPRLGEKLKGAIDEALSKRVAKLEIAADDVLGELKRIGLSDIRELFDAQGQPVDVKNLPEGVARALASVEVQLIGGGETLDDGAKKPAVVRVLKMKFWDKPKALELLGKYLKLWADRVVHTTDPDASKLSLEELRRLAQK